MQKHAFVSAKSDRSGATTLVRPTNWNAEHLAPYFEIPIVKEAGAALAISAALAERNSIYRHPGILIDPAQTGYTQARVVCYISANGGSASNELRIQWSSDSSTWFYLDAASGPGVVIGNTTGAKIGSWVTISGAPSTDVVLRLAHIGGDATTAVTTGTVFLQLK